MQNAKCNRRCGARAEAKYYLDYAEPRGGKACKAGLKFKITNFANNNFAYLAQSTIL